MEEPTTSPTTVKLPARATVKELAELLSIAPTELMTELFKNGVVLTLNDPIDFETAQIMVEELGLGVSLEPEDKEPEIIESRKKQVSSKTAKSRPPVVAVMGHVDHGKTTLLDAIRGASVVEGEAGGITQHISAYQIKHKDKLITFLDTPGHEAFASLRQHGAHLTDLVILVVAADDGVKPQTLEAIKYANQAGVKILVALNKIDKPDANANRVLQELADNGLNPEDWGGDTLVVEVSAKEKTGIDKLLDMTNLVADVEELTAEADGPAEGIVIESHMETGRGPVVTVLVEHGQLKPGDAISAGGASGKVRTLSDYQGHALESAGPSTPAIVTGMKQVPDFGAVFNVYQSDKAAKSAAATAQAGSGPASVATTSKELLAQIHKDRVADELPVIIKADVKGSMTSVVEALAKLKNEKVSVRVVTAGVGPISESDVMTAAASKAVVYGFSVEAPAAIRRLAAKEGVDIKIYKVIYELLDDATTELELRLPPEIVETEVGRLIIKGVFKTTRNEIICGGEVSKGKAAVNTLVRISRDDEQLGEAEVVGVQQGQIETNEVGKGEMCGLRLKTPDKINLKEGDRLDFFTREEVVRKLK